MLFVLMLLCILPVLFLYSGQQFLTAGKSNQDTLQKERIGMLDDAFVSVMNADKFDATALQKEVVRIATLNQDIVDFRIVHFEKGEYIPIAAADASVIGVPEKDIDLYRSATVQPDQSIIFPIQDNTGRYWLVYRAVQVDDGSFYYIYTKLSLVNIDNVFAQREHTAFFSLFFVYLFIILLAYWHIKLTDYRYLYIKVQKANEMKDLFTNMIAHELRAPLTAIRGYASMLIEKPSSPEEEKYARRIKESAERLLAIVNDLLDVARIQSGKLSVEKEQFDASEVIISVTDELHVSAEEKTIQLVHTGTVDTHLVIGDRRRLHQALTNLVSNAIKYTQQGAIEISISETLRATEIRVKDTGMGISSDDQRKLFAPFFRVQSDDVSQITGTGLGMWITKQLIELMSAKIDVESIKGVGTHVVITLPKIVDKR